MKPQKPRKNIKLPNRKSASTRTSKESLKLSEEKFRSLIENSKDMIAIVDTRGVGYFVTPLAPQVLGYEIGERNGKSFLELVHPEDLARIRGLFRKLTRRKGATVSAELRIRHKDGSWRFIESQGTNYLDHPSIQGIVLNFRDVTEKRKSEEMILHQQRYFQALIENSNDVIGLVDPSGRSAYISPSYEKILGYRIQDRLGRSFFEIIHPEDLPGIRQSYGELARTPGATFTGRLRLKNCKGEWRYFEASATNHMENPLVRGIILNFRDVTEKREAENALLKYERLGAIGEMAAGLAHEIRNPLSGISLSAQYLMKKFQEVPEATEQLRNILDQTERLKELVNGTLDFTRDKSTEEKRRLDAMDLFSTSLRLAQVQFGPSHAGFKIHWEFVRGKFFLNINPYRVQQILVNLILNAFQAMGKDGSLVLGCEKEGDWIKFKVKDDGSGIPEDAMARIFEPFFSTKKRGSGLGLSVCQKVAHGYGGEIEVERVSPRGMLFVLKLPLKEEGPVPV